MLEEQGNIDKERPDVSPRYLRFTVLGEIQGDNGAQILDAVRSVWRIVAAWGRTDDVELGDWPEVEECLAQLPLWFQQSLNTSNEIGIKNWLDPLEEREWIWWSGAIVGDRIKIDLECESMPISSWSLAYVLTAAGANVVYKGLWLTEAQARRL